MHPIEEYGKLDLISMKCAVRRPVPRRMHGVHVTVQTSLPWPEQRRPSGISTSACFVFNVASKRSRIGALSKEAEEEEEDVISWDDDEDEEPGRAERWPKLDGKAQSSERCREHSVKTA